MPGIVQCTICGGTGYYTSCGLQTMCDRNTLSGQVDRIATGAVRGSGHVCHCGILKKGLRHSCEMSALATEMLKQHRESLPPLREAALQTLLEMLADAIWGLQKQSPAKVAENGDE